MSDVVEYDQLVAFLKHASVFEIYRLSAAIQNELENPQRLAKVSHKIKEGDLIEYFDSKTNTFIKANIVQKALKNVIVRHVDDGRRWQIPLYWLKIDSREFVFEQSARGLNKNAVKSNITFLIHPRKFFHTLPQSNRGSSSSPPKSEILQRNGSVCRLR